MGDADQSEITVGGGLQPAAHVNQAGNPGRILVNHHIADLCAEGTVVIDIDADRDIRLEGCGHVIEDVTHIGHAGPIGLELLNQLQPLCPTELPVDVAGIGEFQGFHHLGDGLPLA